VDKEVKIFPKNMSKCNQTWGFFLFCFWRQWHYVI